MMSRSPAITGLPFQGTYLSTRRSPGFSLVEVVLALGLFGFAVVALLGVIPLCLQSARQSVDTTRQSAIVEYIAGSLEQRVYSNLSSPQELKWTFDYDGSPTADSGKIYYTVTGSAGGVVTLPGASGTSPGLSRVTLTIASPAGLRKTALSVADMGR